VTPRLGLRSFAGPGVLLADVARRADSVRSITSL